MSSPAIGPGRQRERHRTKAGLTDANIESAQEAKGKLNKLIAGLRQAISTASTPETVAHLEVLLLQAIDMRSNVEAVIANSGTQRAIADTEAREAGIVAFRPVRAWRPGGPDAG